MPLSSFLTHTIFQLYLYVLNILNNFANNLKNFSSLLLRKRSLRGECSMWLLPLIPRRRLLWSKSFFEDSILSLWWEDETCPVGRSRLPGVWQRRNHCAATMSTVLTLLHWASILHRPKTLFWNFNVVVQRC